jgi:hypothetical protein
LWSFADSYVLFEAINEILLGARNEIPLYHSPEDKDIFKNCWVILHNRNQTEFQKPTLQVTEPFNNDFIGATVEELGVFVQQNFGRDGQMGVDPEEGRSNHIANEVFGVLDARTIEDQSILFVSHDSLSLADKAHINIKWGIATRLDEALSRYAPMYSTHHGDATEEDVSLLVQKMDDLAQNPAPTSLTTHELRARARTHDPTVSSVFVQPMSEASSKDKERLKSWFEEVAEKGKDVWIGLRINSKWPMWDVGGIMYRGGADYLQWPDGEDGFDENGVMQGPPVDSK